MNYSYFTKLLYFIANFREVVQIEVSLVLSFSFLMYSKICIELKIHFSGVAIFKSRFGLSKKTDFHFFYEHNCKLEIISKFQCERNVK